MNNEEKEVERLVAIAEDYLTHGHTDAMNKLQARKGMREAVGTMDIILEILFSKRDLK